MKVAIIGGGFAGLATAHFLLKSKQVSVTLFEADRIGGGASGVCSGLLHPYAGFSARRSVKADEALAVTKELIRVAEAHTPKIVSSQAGILRKSMDREQQARLLDHCLEWKDIEQVTQDLFFIHTGITVHSRNYLEGLFRSLVNMGLVFIIHKVQSLKELEEFDHVVIAAGYGIREFPECAHLKVKFLKGQALQMEGRPPFEKSFISKGYIAHYGSDQTFELGSTYERVFEDDQPQIDVATAQLSDKLKLCPDAKIGVCRASVRVAMQQHYLPTIEQLLDHAHVFTGLGSRGLLYHGIFGRALAYAIVSNNNLLS